MLFSLSHIQQPRQVGNSRSVVGLCPTERLSVESPGGASCHPVPHGQGEDVCVSGPSGGPLRKAPAKAGPAGVQWL